jgi:four helix bundle protein
VFAVFSTEGLIMRDFRQIKVWVKAHQLTLEVYKKTAPFPREELYGLTSQLRRACASIPANIAEGFGRGGNVELARFLQIGMGSAYEVEYHALLAKDLGLISNEIYLPS